LTRVAHHPSWPTHGSSPRACSALIQGAHAAYYGFAPLFWRSQGFSDSTIGLLIAEGIIAEVALFAWGRRLVERLGPAGLTACAAADPDVIACAALLNARPRWPSRFRHGRRAEDSIIWTAGIWMAGLTS
jgi:hypothetical protein